MQDAVSAALHCMCRVPLPMGNALPHHEQHGRSKDKDAGLQSQGTTSSLSPGSALGATEAGSVKPMGVDPFAMLLGRAAGLAGEAAAFSGLDLDRSAAGWEAARLAAGAAAGLAAGA